MKISLLRFLMALAIVFCISGYVSLNVLAQGKDTTDVYGRIVYVDHRNAFVVISLGQEQGVKKDSFFEVYRQDIKIGEIKVVKVRRNFSAADIEFTYKNMAIEAGDQLQPFKKTPLEETPLVAEPKQEKPQPNLNKLLKEARKYHKNQEYGLAEDKINEILQLNPGNKKALKLLDKIALKSLEKKTDELLSQTKKHFQNMQYQQAEEKLAEILQLDPENKQALKMLRQVQEASFSAKLDKLFTQAQAYLKEMQHQQAEEKLAEILQLDPENKEAAKLLRKIEQALHKVADLQTKMIVIDISAPKRTILSTAIDVLREKGYLVTSSDPNKYNLQASKDIKLPLAMDIFSDAGPFTRNKVYYTLQIKDGLKSEYQTVNRLIIYFKEAYMREGRLYDSEVKKDSQTYKEAEEMAVKIKDLVENL